MNRTKIHSQELITFQERIQWPYEKKLEYTRDLIKKAYREFGSKLSVSCSFGKDSLVVLALAREVYPDIPVLFANTGVEFPQTIRFKNWLVKEWNLNLIETRPVKPFWKIVNESGFPWPRKVKIGNKMVAPGTPRCCRLLKEVPLRNAIREHGIEATMIGLTYDESYQRKWAIIRKGDKYFPKKDGYWKIYPIAYWNASEVWRFIRENNLPINPAYEKVDRVGCLPCTAHIGWEEQIARVNPALYRLIMWKMREFGDPRARYLLSDFIEAVRGEKA